jgi:predicted Zn finger-like uncharacterized protein
MVVTCPNCRARYAVDPLKIGPGGRTVQCARCDHRWFEKVESPPPADEAVAVPEPPPPAPEVVIRPTTSGASLPAVIPPKPPFPWARVIAVAVLVLVLIGAALFAFRHRLMALVAHETGSPPVLVATAPLPAPPRPNIEVDLTASKIDVVGGRYVVRGQVVNNGTAAGSTSLLRVTFKRDEDVLGERSFPLVEGPLPPGGRASFSQTLDEPPLGTTDVVPAVE